jgi:murein DD-endopeptidase MepM/ murein hydrolase activator NlpD
MQDFNDFLKQIPVSSIFPKHIKPNKYVLFDFSNKNFELNSFDLNKQEEFENYVTSEIKNSGSDYGIGKYAEDRILYRRFELFEKQDSRSFHIGFDIWMKAGTEIFAPIDGKVHSFNNNSNLGDYGPTIILQHEISGYKFYTLYGHLSVRSIENLSENQIFKAGEKLCELGDWSINVNWPPHLHFQIIKDVKDFRGDFPGVCFPKDKEVWMENCPDPNLLLRINL